jgi:very-short-patch-repair endonuclease
MFESLSAWWESNGFTLLVIGSVIFFVICWILGLKPKKGRAGKLQDYIGDILADKPKKKRDTNKTENKCRQIVEDIFNQPFPSMRPDFLRNPASGKNLECDMMNSDMKLCIERNGEQHYKHVEHFHKSPDALKGQIERDKTKTVLLEKNGYTLISIPYTVHYDVLEQYIPHVLSKNPRFKPYVDSYYRRNGVTVPV